MNSRPGLLSFWIPSRAKLGKSYSRWLYCFWFEAWASKRSWREFEDYFRSCLLQSVFRRSCRLGPRYICVLRILIGSFNRSFPSTKKPHFQNEGKYKFADDLVCNKGVWSNPGQNQASLLWICRTALNALGNTQSFNNVPLLFIPYNTIKLTDILFFST